MCDHKLEALGTKLLEVVLEGNTVVLLLHNNVSTCIAQVAHCLIHIAGQFVLQSNVLLAEMCPVQWVTVCITSRPTFVIQGDVVC